MQNKRTFSVKITLKPVGASEAEVINLKDMQAQNFWAMYKDYLNGQGDALGLAYMDLTVLAKPTPEETEVLEKTILFADVKTVEKTVQKVTTTTDFDCKDLDLCK